MSDLSSGLYTGVVTHSRFRPRPHKLRYRIFMFLLDLDEIAKLGSRLRLFGDERFALTGFARADHQDGDATGLRAQVEGYLVAAGLPHGGPIRLLTMPRILGHVFNPISVWFCHATDGTLAATLYEVRNTFGERHSYLVPADGSPVLTQSADKAFYVSPFMEMDLRYQFRVLPPGDEVAIGVDVHDAKGRLLAAAFAGKRQDLTDRTIWRAFASHPLMSLGVLVAIHWEALKIWLKGERIRTRPPAPSRPVTLGTRQVS